MTTCAPFCFDALYLYSEYHNELFMVSQWVRILADKQTSTNRFDFLFVFVVEAYVRIRSPFFMFHSNRLFSQAIVSKIFSLQPFCFFMWLC